MKLYYAKGACSLAVRIVIHELGLKAEYIAVDLNSKKVEPNIDFFGINAKGSVPVLIIDANQTLTENAVILQYLADTYKGTQLLPPFSDFKRYRVLEMLNFICTDLHKGCGPLFNPKVCEKDKKEIFIPNIKKVLKILDKELAKNTYLTGDELTLPDPYLFVVLSWMPHLAVDLSEFSNIKRFQQEIKNRQSVQQSLKEEGLA